MTAEITSANRARLVNRLQGWSREHDAAGLIAGFVQVTPTGQSVTEIASVDCAPAHLIAAADALLHRAAERVAAVSGGSASQHATLAWIERIRAEIGLHLNNQVAS